MKVLIISYMYPNVRNPNLGIFIKGRLINLSRLCDIKLISPYPWIPSFGVLKRWIMPYFQKQDNIEVYRPKYLPLPGSFFNFIKGIWCFVFIKGTVRKLNERFNFDIIHAHRVFPEGFAAVLLGKFFKKPVVITIHGSDINSLHKNIFIRKMILFTLNRADEIIAISVALKTKILEVGAVESKKISVLFNGVDLDTFKVQSKKKARERLSLPQEKKIILFVGNLVDVKNPLLLIEAVCRLKRGKNGEYLFVIIGEGSLKGEIENRISKYSLGEAVVMAGAKPHEKLPVWMAAADCLVLPSKSEGMGVVLLEAMACGLPIIATRVGGIPEVITDGENGILITSNNVGELEKSIENLIDDERLRERIGKNGALFIKEKNLTWQAEAFKTLSIYKRILKYG